VKIGQSVEIDPSEAAVKFDILPDEKREEYERELERKLEAPGSAAHKKVMRAELANLHWMKQFNAHDDDESRRIALTHIENNIKYIIKKKRKHRIYRVLKTAGAVAAAAVVIPVVLTVAVAAVLSAPVVLTGGASWNNRKQR
jgi:DNA repair photolyase